MTAKSLRRKAEQSLAINIFIVMQQILSWRSLDEVSIPYPTCDFPVARSRSSRTASSSWPTPDAEDLTSPDKCAVL